MKKSGYLLFMIMICISCSDEGINPSKYTMPVQLSAMRNEDGIILQYYTVLTKSSQCLNLYTPNTVPVEKMEILHSEGDTLNFKVIHTTHELSDQYLFKTTNTGIDHYFRIVAYGDNAAPYVSPPIQVQWRKNPDIYQLIELPHDYIMQIGNFSSGEGDLVYSRSYRWENSGSCCEDYSIISFDPDKNMEELLYPNAFYPQWSPDASYLAFHSNFSNNKNDDNFNIGIYFAEVDSVTQITFGENRFEIPVWYPDGKKIVFLSYNESKYQLWDVYSLDPLTGIYELLVSDPGFGVLHERLSFSPEGTWLAYSDFDEDEHQNIYALQIDTRQAKPLVESIWIDRHPSFSPDGKYLAFLSYRSGKDEIWVLELLTDKLIQLTGYSDVYIDSELIWSPDSNKIYFKAYRDEKFGIYYSDVE